MTHSMLTSNNSHCSAEIAKLQTHQYCKRNIIVQSKDDSASLIKFLQNQTVTNYD